MLSSYLIHIFHDGKHSLVILFFFFKLFETELCFTPCCFRRKCKNSLGSIINPTKASPDSVLFLLYHAFYNKNDSVSSGGKLELEAPSIRGSKTHFSFLYKESPYFVKQQHSIWNTMWSIQRCYNKIGMSRYWYKPRIWSFTIIKKKEIIITILIFIIRKNGTLGSNILMFCTKDCHWMDVLQSCSSSLRLFPLLDDKHAPEHHLAPAVGPRVSTSLCEGLKPYYICQNLLCVCCLQADDSSTSMFSSDCIHQLPPRLLLLCQSASLWSLAQTQPSNRSLLRLCAGVCVHVHACCVTVHLYKLPLVIWLWLCP